MVFKASELAEFTKGVGVNRENYGLSPGVLWHQELREHGSNQDIHQQMNW